MHPLSLPRLPKLLPLGALSLAPQLCLGAESLQPLALTGHWAGYSALAVFALAYGLVVLEERLNLRKSKPVMVAAGIIWALTAAAASQRGAPSPLVAQAFRHHLLAFAEVFLFLLVAMTYVNTLAERGVFEALRAWLISRGLSLRALFWLTGLLAFFLSPVIDNLTTALLMATVVTAIGQDNRPFVVIACINVVVAANAGGAFSPFGDITTLMVWQAGQVAFWRFFALFVPALVNWLVPAALMALAIPNERPPALNEPVVLKSGAWTVMTLFALTLVLAVSFYNGLHLPPVLGMTTGLGLLKCFGYYLKRRDQARARDSEREEATRRPAVLGITTGLGFWRSLGRYRRRRGPARTWHNEAETRRTRSPSSAKAFDIFKQLARAEWDTLMFFYGIILCVGGLGALGYLAFGSQFLYTDLGPTPANILIGLLSALIDNVPVMVAVLTMGPDMGLGQWLLVTLTAGVGGSLLSIGSAAGVAVMGQARGVYTFFAHLKWSWAIALGYAAAIWVHLTLNAGLFQVG